MIAISGLKMLKNYHIPILISPDLIVCSKDTGVLNSTVLWKLGIYDLTTDCWKPLDTGLNLSSVECVCNVTFIDNKYVLLTSMAESNNRHQFIFYDYELIYDNNFNLLSGSRLFHKPCMFFTKVNGSSIFSRKVLKDSMTYYLACTNTKISKLLRLPMRSQPLGIRGQFGTEAVIFSFAERHLEESYSLDLASGKLCKVTVGGKNVYKPSILGNTIVYCKKGSRFEDRTLVVEFSPELHYIGNIYQNKNLLS